MLPVIFAIKRLFACYEKMRCVTDEEKWTECWFLELQRGNGLVEKTLINDPKIRELF